ncbi:Protein SSH4 [Linum perenne]
MHVWEHVLLIISSVFLFSILIIIICRRYYHCFKRPARDSIVDPAPRSPTLQDGIAKLHHRNDDGTTLHPPIEFVDSKRRGNYYVFKRAPSSRPLFNWSDHPSLITDAVENGWSRFGFTAAAPSQLPSSSPSVRSSILLGLCAAGDYYYYHGGGGRETLPPAPEISWEVSQASADFMQKIRLNSGLKRVSLSNPSTSAASVIRTALPLPGPPLGNNINSAFPQEAYFEITILYSRSGGGGGEEYHQNSRRSSSAAAGGKGKNGEGEKIKLIKEIPNPNSNSAALVHVSSSHRINRIEELKVSAKDDSSKSEAVAVAVGLSVGSGCPPFKLPGSYQGSIGFNSNGSVYLDGLKLVFETEASSDWAKAERVIGCGFDPRQKKVFFTVDGEVVHIIHCKADEFGTPLYPTIAANSDTVVLVNLGQSSFSYAPANNQRTPNPCFIGPMVKSPAALGYDYEDSRELFSMGRIDSQWLDLERRATSATSTKYPHSNNNNNDNNMAREEYDEESEADLFEIVLDSSSGRSPNIVL